MKKLLIPSILISFLIPPAFFYGVGYFVIDRKVKEHVGPWGYPLAKEGIFLSAIDGVKKKEIYTKHVTRKVKRNESGDKHLILSGGSNTFGTGLDPEDTLAGIMNQDKENGYDTTLLSFPGWGANNVLAYLIHRPLDQFIQQKNGVMIYFFIEDHFRRVCGYESTFTWSVGRSPWFSLENDRPVLQGLYRESMSYKKFLLIQGIDIVRKKMMSMFGKVNSQYIVPNAEPITDECIELTSHIIQEIQLRYLEQFPKGKFIVSFFPDFHLHELKEFYQNLFSHLKKMDINTLDLRVDYVKEYKRRNFTPKDVQQNDGHISRGGNEILIKLIKENLLIKN